jgi:uncharacterized delta-60 repeat protein
MNRRKGLVAAFAGAAVFTGALGSDSSAGPAGRPAIVDLASAVAAQPDGQLVVAGSSGNRREGRRRMALVRYTTRGRLDRNFGAGGKVLTSFGSRSESRARAVAVQTDGKVVLAGEVNPRQGQAEFGLARYTGRGRLDPSFGHAGKVVTRFGSRRNVSEASALALQPDGKIVALGSWFRSAINGPTFIALARYTRRGRLDPSFGHGGKLVTSFAPRSDSSAGSLLIQRDGKLVVTGTAFIDSRSANGYFAVGLARYDTDGTLDRSFGRGGRVVSKLFEGGASAGGAVLQRDGRIVVTASDGGRRNLLVRYTVNGRLDSTFGVGGKAVTSKRGLGLLALQGDGKFVDAGSVNALHGDAFFLRRYTQKGDADSSFGQGGKVFTDFGASARADALAVQANDKIVVAGSRAFKDFAAARYTSDGRLDGSFGSGGKVTTDFASAWANRG